MLQFRRKATNLSSDLVYWKQYFKKRSQFNANNTYVDYFAVCILQYPSN